MKSVKKLESVKTQLFAQNNDCKLSIVNGGGIVPIGQCLLNPGGRTPIYGVDTLK
jgi:hypothetical protein